MPDGFDWDAAGTKVAAPSAAPSPWDSVGTRVTGAGDASAVDWNGIGIPVGEQQRQSAADAAVPFMPEPGVQRMNVLPLAVDAGGHVVMGQNTLPGGRVVSSPELYVPEIIASPIRGIIKGGQEILGQRPVDEPESRADILSALGLAAGAAPGRIPTDSGYRLGFAEPEAPSISGPAAPGGGPAPSGAPAPVLAAPEAAPVIPEALPASLPTAGGPPTPSGRPRVEPRLPPPTAEPASPAQPLEAASAKEEAQPKTEPRPVKAPNEAKPGDDVTFFDPTRGDYTNGKLVGVRKNGAHVVDMGTGPYSIVPERAVAGARAPKPEPNGASEVKTVHGTLWTAKGKNAEGETVYENPAGVKATMEGDVPWTEATKDGKPVATKDADRPARVRIEQPKPEQPVAKVEQEAPNKRTPRTPKSFWTYQADDPPGPPSHMTQDQWESLSPGMRREIFRSQPELWHDAKTPEAGTSAPEQPKTEPVEPVSPTPQTGREPAPEPPKPASGAAPEPSQPVETVSVGRKSPERVKPKVEPEAPAARKLYRGTGREDQSSAYNPLGAGVPIAGPGNYWAFDEERAKTYGPKVESGQLDLKKPLLINSDEQWRTLTKRAGWKFPNPIGQPKATVEADTARLKKVVQDDGHDGIVFDWDDESPYDVDRKTQNPIKRLREAIGHPQVVDYRESANVPSAESTAKQPAKETLPNDLDLADFTPVQQKVLRGENPYPYNPVLGVGTSDSELVEWRNRLIDNRPTLDPEAKLSVGNMKKWLKSQGIDYTQEASKSNTDSHGPSASIYFKLENGKTIRLSDHNYPSGAAVDLHYGMRNGDAFAIVEKALHPENKTSIDPRPRPKPD
jgi:hypothetical protein